ncbi:hypothetical protein LOK49_LG10G01465 [Camellia lanceoleosa]|uniref:Uncharacterized protein n=1 Tax=Camellia lanceoleosa TaxID=1840588 RepID=A0ACC0GBZ3_9ERIC|nr:hypothetical protein LOK49_LG10G01465 [Camellia lanceoleosa]
MRKSNGEAALLSTRVQSPLLHHHHHELLIFTLTKSPLSIATTIIKSQSSIAASDLASFGLRFFSITGQQPGSSSSSSSYNFQDQLVFYVTPIEALSKEGHSVVVVVGFVKLIMEEIKKGVSAEVQFREMRSGECYFLAMEVLAKHDEKYMPAEVAAVVETNKKKIEVAAVDEKAKS